METPKLLWVKNNLPGTWSSARHFFDLSDFLTWKSTGGSEVRSLCTTVCKWTYDGSLKSWNESYFRQIGLGDLADEKFGRIGKSILR
jgi:D-ribulokinase